MASIVIASVPVHGHVTPLLEVARHFTGRGDRVRFMTGTRFADQVAATGARHLPLPADADMDDQQDLHETYPERSRLRGARAIAFDLEHFFVLPGRAQFEALAAALEDEPTDIVLTDPGFVAGALLLTRPRGERPPVVMCGVLPLMLASRDTAPYGMGLTPRPGRLGHLRNAALAALVTRTVLPRAERLVQQISQDVSGRALPFPILDWPRHADAIAQFSVTEFEYPRSDAPPTLHFVGPISGTSSDPVLPTWWPDLDGTRPVIHVTQGTIANRDYRQIIAPTLEALAGDEVLVVVSTGGRPLDTLPPLPDNARAATYLPYDLLLPLTDVFVTNGGYGGVHYALRHGVPVVTSGGKEDKPEVAGRIAWSGVGRRLRSETPSAATVHAAVQAVLHEPEYRANARRMAAAIAASPGVTGLAAIVDDVMAQARHA